VAKLVAAIAERHSVPVVSIVRRRDSIEILKKQLPRATFIASDTEGWEEKVKAAAPAGGFRAGLDSVGGQIGTFVLDSLTNGGTLITYGDLSGAPLQANALSFAMRDTRIRGLVVTKWPANPEKERRADLALAVDFARARSDLFPVAAEFPLSQIADAARAVERPGRDGLVLLHPGSI
jgi:NADPH:quinone reductase-like Zn-dependent oxidoreductase